MNQEAKCACETCHCKVKPGKAVVRNGKQYCSATCANECTQNTCVCVHEQCEGGHEHKH